MEGVIQNVTVSDLTDKLKRRLRHLVRIEKGGFTSKKGRRNLREKKSGSLLGLNTAFPSRIVQKGSKTFLKDGRIPLGFHQLSELNVRGSKGNKGEVRELSELNVSGSRGKEGET